MPAVPLRLASAFCASALLIAQDAPLTRLHADLDFLTSDVLTGRVSLSPQAEIAARFIDAEFRKAGLTSQLQAFPVVGYRSDPKQRQLLLTRGGASRPLHAFTGGFYRDIAVRAPVVFAGYGITALEYAYDDYATVNASGRIVLIFDHQPQEDSAASVFNGTGYTLHAGRAAKVLNARRHGGLAVLIATEPSHHRRVLASPPRAPLRAPARPQAIDDPFTLSEADVTDLLSVTGRTPVELQDAIDASLRPQSQPLRDTELEIRASNAEQHRGSSLNAIGLLEGSDPELKSETILISAHYDHLGVQNEHLYNRGISVQQLGRGR
jgi:hypothetical protein